MHTFHNIFIIFFYFFNFFLVHFYLLVSGGCLVHPPTRINGTDGEIGYSQCQSPDAPPFGVELCLIPPHHAFIIYYILNKLSTVFGVTFSGVFKYFSNDSKYEMSVSSGIGAPNKFKVFPLIIFFMYRGCVFRLIILLFIDSNI